MLKLILLLVFFAQISSATGITSSSSNIRQIFLFLCSWVPVLVINSTGPVLLKVLHFLEHLERMEHLEVKNIVMKHSVELGKNVPAPEFSGRCGANESPSDGPGNSNQHREGSRRSPSASGGDGYGNSSKHRERSRRSPSASGGYGYGISSKHRERSRRSPSASGGDGYGNNNGNGADQLVDRLATQVTIN